MIDILINWVKMIGLKQYNMMQKQNIQVNIGYFIDLINYICYDIFLVYIDMDIIIYEYV